MKGSSVTVDFQDVLAIHTPEENHFKYFFYPNPTKGILHLKSENNESLIYQVIGFDGKVVAKGKFVGSTSVDLSSFSNGIYYVTITNNSWISTQKIIKY
jgi:hypothetical protein